MSFPSPATKTASKRSRLRLRRSQLLDFMRSRLRHCVSRFSESSASAGVEERANNRTMKLLAIAKLTRESAFRQLAWNPYVSINTEWRRRTRMPKGLQMVSAQLGQEVVHLASDGHGARPQRCAGFDGGLCALRSQERLEDGDFGRDVGQSQAPVAVESVEWCRCAGLATDVRVALQPLGQLDPQWPGDFETCFQGFRQCPRCFYRATRDSVNSISLCAFMIPQGRGTYNMF